MNESDISDDEINGPAGRKRRCIMSSTSESSDSDFDYDTELSDTENEDGEEVDEVDPNNSILSEEWLPQNTERPPFPFTAHPGKTFNTPPKKVPLFYLEKFLDEELIKLITEQTNLYAAQFFDNDPELKPRSRIRKWKDTNEAKIKIFLGLLILQGIIGKPVLELYFSRRRRIKTQFFYETMSERRFALLCKFLHFADNLSFVPNTSNRKTYKIDPIINNLSEKFKSFYVCEREICVDESLLLWKGNLSWKQYISTKRARFGMKLFILSESQSGYVQNIILYTGKDTNYSSNYPQEKQSTRIVLELTHDLLNKGYRIYLDNFYTLIHLAKLLCQNNTDIVGTMRINRVGIPSEIKTKKLQKNKHIVRFKDKLIVLKWKDKKDVLMLSSIHNDEKTMIEKRGRRQEKPNVVLDYNKNMGGVDLGDGVMVAYTAARNRLKKYKKIFLRLTDMCCLNAYIIYKKDKGHLDRLHFLIECVEKLVDNNIVKTHPKTSTSSFTPKPSRLVERHFP